MATVTTQCYLRSWYDDAIHEYGINNVVEYFVQFQGRGLCFHFNKTMQQSKCFFRDTPHLTYGRYGQRITALTKDVELPVAQVQQYFDMATLQEKLQILEKTMMVPDMVTLTKEEVNEEFDKATEAFNHQAYDQALQGFKKIVYFCPENIASVYNVTCVYSQQNKLDDAFYWLTATIQAGYKDILKLVRDTDLSTILYSGRPDVHKLLREFYGYCILENFQGEYDNRINIARYAQCFRTTNIEQLKEGLEKLKHFNIDINTRWKWDDDD